MAKDIDPLKIELLIPMKADLQGVKPVLVMDIMAGMSKNFHPEGLFSVEIFGKVGETTRSSTFAYINLNIPVFHPLLFKVICDLKELYQDIMAGKAYAVFDEDKKDFIKSNIAEGETGFAFFVKHFPKLQFEERKSITRAEYIRLVEMYRDNPYIEQLVLLPAGVRDYVVEEDGKPSEDEINGMYRSIMAVAGSMENVRADVNPEFIDASRYNLQIKLLEIYRYLIGLILGKHKMIQGAFLSRKVSNTTRNVITSYIPGVQEFGDATSVRSDQTLIGLYQFTRDIMPVAVHSIVGKYLPKVFSGPNTPAQLVNPKTLHKEMVTISPREYKKWMTYEGIEKMADRFSEESMRHYPIMINEYYMGLIYRGNDGTFKFIQDIDEIPESRSRDDVKPITMAEFLYMCLYEEANDAYGYTTRYPISGYGSTYPGGVALRTTVRSEVRTELDDYWQPMPVKAVSFPINGMQFFNSMSPAPKHVPRMGADYDGDQCSHYCVMTQEAKREVKKMLASRDYYMNLDGTMAFSQNNDYISLALKYLTVR